MPQACLLGQPIGDGVQLPARPPLLLGNVVERVQPAPLPLLPFVVDTQLDERT